MFPLPLLSTTTDNLEKMKARHALVYQNTFMKNALVRALNTIYEVAPRMKPTHPQFGSFMEYVEMVRDMIDLHLEGDDVFFRSLSQQCSAFRHTSNKNTMTLQSHLSGLRSQIRGWKKNPSSYQPAHLQDCLGRMEATIIEALHKQVVRYTGEALPQSVSDERLAELIKENMVWLSTNSDIRILLPFCVSHHDPKTSKHWPPITNDAVQVMPEFVKAHPHLWKFAPFDAVTRSSKKILL